jgi:hypothetical protein
MTAPESPRPEVSRPSSELQLATVVDMLAELRRRKVRFVFVGFEDTNTKRNPSSWLSGGAASARHLQRLARMAQVALRELKHQQEESGGNE